MNKIENYRIGNKEIQFNVTEFLSNSKGLKSKFNYNINEDLSEISKEMLLTMDYLKPIVESVDFNEIIMNIARKDVLNEKMVITSDFYVVSDNNVFASKLIVETVEAFTCVVMLEKSLDELLEDYGMQGGEASGGMGDVKLPSVSGSSEMPKMDGSGDFPQSTPKKKDDEKVSFYTREELLKISEAFELLSKIDGNIINESVEPHINVPLKSELMKNTELLNKFKSMFFVNFVDVGTTNEDANLKLDCHFNSSDEILNNPEIETFVNRPISRKVLKVDEPFSCNTLEGITQGKAGDYVVIGVDGEIYPCDAEILHKTYIKVE